MIAYTTSASSTRSRRSSCETWATKEAREVGTASTTAEWLPARSMTLSSSMSTRAKELAENVGGRSSRSLPSAATTESSKGAPAQVRSGQG